MSSADGQTHTKTYRPSYGNSDWNFFEYSFSTAGKAAGVYKTEAMSLKYYSETDYV